MLQKERNLIPTKVKGGDFRDMAFRHDLLNQAALDIWWWGQKKVLLGWGNRE